MQAARIKSAIEAGEIRKIVVIDDAFDPPSMTDDDAGPVLDFLEQSIENSVLTEFGIDVQVAKDAVAAIGASDYNAEAVLSVVGTLYEGYVKRFDGKFDPAKRFEVSKGDNLRMVRPLLKLLGSCENLEIRRLGSSGDGVDLAEFEPDVVFVDYYLDATISSTDNPAEGKGVAAISASMKILRDVLRGNPGSGPSVMLMSSHSVKERADKFRREIRDDNPVFASRFHFLDKNQIDEREGGCLTLEPAAADALLDVAQRHKFSGAIEDALTAWKDGVEKASKSVWKQITELQLEDFAYLARFRLADEGQPLSRYLEWFFGEVLTDAVAKSVDWERESFRTLDKSAERGKPGSEIEGAFDGPTERVAELYFAARVDARSAGSDREFCTGDLLLSSENPNEILAIITPECDLIKRRDGRRSAPRITVVAGQLKAIDGARGSVADFVYIDSQPRNVNWALKDVRTLSFEEVSAGQNYSRTGTLRPLYAHELQGRVIRDLSRVGLAVAPAMGVTASCSVSVLEKSGSRISVELELDGKASCAVIPSRGGSDRPRIVYHRGFVLQLLTALQKLDKDGLDSKSKTGIQELEKLETHTKIFAQLCRDGREDGEGALGIATFLERRKKGNNNWCEIIVNTLLSDEASIEAIDG